MAAKNAAPSVDLTWSVNKPITVTVTAAGVVTIEGLTGDRNYSALYTAGTTTETEAVSVPSKNITFDDSNWTKEEGGTLICKLTSAYPDFYKGDTMKVKVVLTDGSTVEGSVAIPAN